MQSCEPDEADGASRLLAAGDKPPVDKYGDSDLTCDWPRWGDESGVTAEYRGAGMLARRPVAEHGRVIDSCSSSVMMVMDVAERNPRLSCVNFVSFSSYWLICSFI